MKKLFLLCLLVGLFITAWLKVSVYNPVMLADKTEVLIAKGATSGEVASRLFEAGIIKNPWLFKIFARIKGLDKHLRAGEYEFEKAVSMADVVEKIYNGDVLYRRITLPEGLTTVQMLELIKNNEFLVGDISVSVGEGDLLPETYTFFRGESRDNIVLQAKRAMQQELENAWNNRDEYIPVKNKKELLVLASIIEKETGLPEERGLVASVFVNRLRKGMRLQTDPTVIYAITKGQRDLGRLLTKADLTIDSPYNTYKYYGLPPTAICNPGKNALNAAAKPEISDFLYFVASGNGGHNFAFSLREHNNNVLKWKNKK
ncbi:MAG: endolytic transglycosylase MltG [Alphaproteobacteria bacterium]|nr:endolytic transglycosylase MltG [Alphaproteobacteria bacterium]